MNHLKRPASNQATAGGIMRAGRPAWTPEKLLFTVEEAAELLSISRAQVYRLIDLQELLTVKIGKSRRVSYAQLESFRIQLEQRGGFIRL